MKCLDTLRTYYLRLGKVQIVVFFLPNTMVEHYILFYILGKFTVINTKT